MLMKEKIDANKVTRKNHCLFPADESDILRSSYPVKSNRTMI